MPLGAFKTALLGAAGVSTEDTGSWHALQSIVLSSNQSSVSMSSSGSSTAWSDYQDLVLLVCARGTNNGVGIGVTTTFNSSASGNYHWQEYTSNGASMGAAANSSMEYFRVAHLPGADQTANFFCGSINHMAHVNVARNKSILTQDGHESAHSTEDNTVTFRAVGWENRSAITEFTMNPDGNFLAGSRFDLYGIKGD